MLQRHWYILDLTDDNQSTKDETSEAGTFDYTISRPTPDDAETLADLMLQAYAGTIDDDGGIMEDARSEVAHYFSGEYGDPITDSCRLARDTDGNGACATLITRWGEQELPLVAFVMTHPDHQGRGLARNLLERSIRSLREAGETRLRAVITDGNTASERLFRSLGFEKVPERKTGARSL